MLGRTDADVLAWDTYVLGAHLSSGYHLTGWRRVIEEAFGHQTYYLSVRGPGGIIQGVVPLVLLASRGFGRFLVSLPFVNYGGLIADSQEGRSLLEACTIEQAKALKAVNCLRCCASNINKTLMNAHFERLAARFIHVW